MKLQAKINLGSLLSFLLEKILENPIECKNLIYFVRTNFWLEKSILSKLFQGEKNYKLFNINNLYKPRRVYREYIDKNYYSMIKALLDIHSLRNLI